MRMLPVAVVLFLLVVPVLSTDKDDLVGFGNSFYDNCASAEKLADAKADHAEDMQGMFCLGFVEGLTMGVKAADIKHSTGTFCEPSGVTNLQTIRIIRKFIADHPERGHEPTAILAIDALHKAYPCRT